MKLQATGEPIGVPLAPATLAARCAVYVVPTASCTDGVSVARYAPVETVAGTLDPSGAVSVKLEPVSVEGLARARTMKSRP